MPQQRPAINASELRPSIEAKGIRLPLKKIEAENRVFVLGESRKRYRLLGEIVEGKYLHGIPINQVEEAR